MTEGSVDDEFFEKQEGNIKAGIQIRNLRKVMNNDYWNKNSGECMFEHGLTLTNSPIGMTTNRNNRHTQNVHDKQGCKIVL